MYKSTIQKLLAGVICCLIVNAVNAQVTDPFDAVKKPMMSC